METNFRSVPEVFEETTLGAESPERRILIELPHGATMGKHYFTYRQQLKGEYPKDLSHFFFVNTDVGSPEAGLHIAEKILEKKPDWQVTLFRSLIPRTFIDCNRIISLQEEEFKKGGVTPGIPPYVTEPEDMDFLQAKYRAYQDEAERVYSSVCGSDGFALMLHSYAPRTVGISRIDDKIVENLHRVYLPDTYDKWPIRPEIDFITTTLEGIRMAPAGLVARMKRGLSSAGFEVAEGKSFSCPQGGGER